MKHNLEKLMIACVHYLEQHGYSDELINRHNKIWTNKLIPFMTQNGIKNLDSSILVAYTQSQGSRSVFPYEKGIVRSIRILTEFHEKGEISRRFNIPVNRDFSGLIGQQISSFLLHLKKIRRSEQTVYEHKMYLHRFFTYLTINEVETIEDLHEIDIIRFVSTPTNNNINVVSSIRMFLRYLYEEGFSPIELTAPLERLKFSKEERIPSVYSKVEVLKIESSVQRSNDTGKRDYAILLLATRLGLRASDIAHLTFSNIDWELNKITICQYKTKKELEIPLLAAVGESLIDYLKYARKICNTERIFVHCRAPYTPMTNKSVCNAIRRVFENSGIDISDRKHGPHALRHSLASRFLENQEAMPIISEALGHQNTDTTMTYLRIDFKSLSQCALNVPTLSSDFYMQKGGAFYEKI